MGPLGGWKRGRTCSGPLYISEPDNIKPADGEVNRPRDSLGPSDRFGHNAEWGLIGERMIGTARGVRGQG